MNIDNTSSIPSATEKGIESAGREAENGIMTSFEGMAQEALRLFRKWNVPKTTVFGEWQGHMVSVTVYASDSANLPGAHAGTKGE